MMKCFMDSWPLDLVNADDADDLTFNIHEPPPIQEVPLQEHPHCKEILNRFSQFESHLLWLTTNIQHVSIQVFTHKKNILKTVAPPQDFYYFCECLNYCES